MSRMHVLQMWTDAAAYSGEQIGDRWSNSKELHMLSNGKANIALYADDNASYNRTTAPKKQRSAFSRACLQDSNFERLNTLKSKLLEDYESGSLSLEDYQYACKSLQPRIDRAWQKIVKTRGWDFSKEDHLADDVEQSDDCEEATPTENTTGTLLSLSDKNIFLNPLQKCLTAYKTFIKLVNMFKEIIREGLL